VLRAVTVTEWFAKDLSAVELCLKMRN